MKTKVKFTLFISLINYCNKLSRDSFIPLYPFLMIAFATTASNIQWMIACYFFGLTLGRFVVPVLADSMGNIKILRISLGVFILSSIWGLFSIGLLDLKIIRFCQGLSIASVPILGRVCVHRIYQTKGLVKLLALASLITIWSPAIAMLISGSLQSLGVWRLIFLIFIVMAFSLFALSYFIRPTNSRQHVEIKSLIVIIKGILLKIRFWRLVIILGVQSINVTGFFVIYPFIMVHQYGFNAIDLAGMSALVIAFMLLGKLLSGILVGRIKEHCIKYLALTISLVSALLIIQADSLMLFLIASGLNQLAAGIIMPFAKASVLDIDVNASASAGALLAGFVSLVVTLGVGCISYLGLTSQLALGEFLMVTTLLALLSMFVLGAKKEAMRPQ